ncbi:polysaccharide lyase [Bdellovibrio svalbardensis]|uniref:Polysaccharide lyase n=1 Tax=Bdellovibrio svalbardensis TaxID=2972972 RepID=A0ABT6DHE0_9BACT|nr:polysaccharide lyase [Bdellovibrio svalbardensis]MDG0816278.1 polysaccharide lyase [Bdellovibrio svalbardensis]
MNHLYIALVILASMQAHGMGKKLPEQASEVFFSDFEKGDFSGWDIKRIPQDHSAIIQSDVVRSGKKAVRFELRKDENVSGGFRSELRDPYFAPLFKETWYSLSFYVPEEFPVTESNSCVFAQWHDQQDPGDGDRNPPIAIRLRGTGELAITGRYNAEKIQKGVPGPELTFYQDRAFKKGEWNDFVVRVFWSYEATGLVQIWRNGQQIVDYRGPIGYNDDKGPYLKIGVYCRETPTSPLVAYHDNYRRAPTAKQLKGE